MDGRDARDKVVPAKCVAAGVDLSLPIGCGAGASEVNSTPSAFGGGAGMPVPPVRVIERMVCVVRHDDARVGNGMIEQFDSVGDAAANES